MKKLKQILNYNNRIKGFMLGMALIVAAIIIIIIVSISNEVSRNIGKSTTPINSTLAYSIADSVIRCVDSINNNIGTTTTGNFVSVIPITTTINNNSQYATNSIKCLNSRLLEGVDFKIGTAGNPDFSAPSKYVGGVVMNNLFYYNFGYDRTSFPQSCVYLQIFASSTATRIYKRFTATGRVPCDGNNVSRSITLEKQERI
ncbi:MAG: hypothetical protein ORN26_01215 [Candidatus Pacebacteria bacterium]|nr:hypothetical protein [Candidatus Paceibacterota bacterium]